MIRFVTGKFNGLVLAFGNFGAIHFDAVGKFEPDLNLVKIGAAHIVPIQ